MVIITWVSGVKKVSKRQTQSTPKEKDGRTVIAKAMAEAMQIAIQTMAEMQSKVEETQ